MVVEKKKDVSSGCIKITKGPWIVHRTTKDGGVASRDQGSGSWGQGEADSSFSLRESSE